MERIEEETFGVQRQRKYDGTLCQSRDKGGGGFEALGGGIIGGMDALGSGLYNRVLCRTV